MRILAVQLEVHQMCQTVVGRARYELSCMTDKVATGGKLILTF